MLKTISLVIPVYNEFKALPRFLSELKSAINDLQSITEIIFVDNGSNDGSGQLIQKFIDHYDNQQIQILLLHELHKGKGYAVKTGISRTSSDYLVIVDADNEYKVSDLTKLIEAAQLTGANLILGSRYTESQPMRKISNSKIISLYFNTGHYIFTVYFNLLFKSKLRDPATMWKLMEGSFVRSLNLTGNGFNLDFELVAAHIKLNKVIIEVPISYHSRGPQDGKKIKLVIDPIIWVFSFVVYACRKPKNFLS